MKGRVLRSKIYIDFRFVELPPGVMTRAPQLFLLSCTVESLSCFSAMSGRMWMTNGEIEIAFVHLASCPHRTRLLEDYRIPILDSWRSILESRFRICQDEGRMDLKYRAGDLLVSSKTGRYDTDQIARTVAFRFGFLPSFTEVCLVSDHVKSSVFLPWRWIDPESTFRKLKWTM